MPRKKSEPNSKKYTVKIFEIVDDQIVGTIMLDNDYDENYATLLVDGLRPRLKTNYFARIEETQP